MKRFLLHILFFCLPMLLIAQQAAKPTHKAGEILVQLWEEGDIQDVLLEVNQAYPNKQCVQLRRNVAPDWKIYTLSFDANKYDEQTILKNVRDHAMVKAVTFNDIIEWREKTPNDALYEQQKNFYDIIHAPEAWEITTGGLTPNGDTIVIAVVDSGADLEHPDLKPNLWKNYAETPNDNIDQDSFIGNYIDDYDGWVPGNFDDNLPIQYHGITVQGVVGAVGDNDIGVSGINWHVKIMPIKAGTKEDLTAASYYVYNHRKAYNESMGAQGAFVVAMNLSLGFSNQTYQDGITWCNSFDELGQVGVLTIGATANSNSNVDVEGDLPSLCPSQYFVCVTATDNADNLSAAYGKTNVDLAAPGSSIMSTTNSLDANGQTLYYGVRSGTSYSCPMVAGTVGLLYSVPDFDVLSTQAKLDPAQAALNVKSAIFTGSDKILGLTDRTTTGGRLNVMESIQAMRALYGIADGPIDVLNIQPNPATTEIRVSLQIPKEFPYAIRMYNMLGQVVYDAVLQDTDYLNKYYTINTANLPMGYYSVTIVSGKRARSKPVFIYRK